jgi:hypothetical protein
MQATNPKDMRIDGFLLLPMRSIGEVRILPRVIFLLSSFLGLAFLLACSFSCAPSSPQGNGKQSGSASSASNDIPEITDEKIRQEINDVYIREVPEESGTGEPISWRIDYDEPKEFTIVEKQLEGDRASMVIDIKTQSAPGARNPRYLAGQIRTKWELETGWALRTWEIVETENISMKYKNLPKPTAQNSNR